MRDSVPSGSYSSVCNVLRQWNSCSSLLIESTDSMIYTHVYFTYEINKQPYVTCPYIISLQQSYNPFLSCKYVMGLHGLVI